MRLIDAFVFSEPHEADVLWVKLNVEAGLVAHWVAVENSYTFQGEYKGHHLRELMASDARFASFRSRLHVVECEMAPHFDPGSGPVTDADALTIERLQRDSSVEHLLSTCDDSDWVLVSDVDECLDVTAPKRRRLLLKKLAGAGDLVLVPRIRYWFDFDNRGLARRCVPLVSIAALRRDPRLYAIREQHIARPVLWRHEMVFEYSYCFPREKILRKFETFSHAGFIAAEVDDALRYNHRPNSHLRARRLAWDAENWFLTRRLNSRNSPAFVREHLAELSTGVVARDYRVNRVRDFPEFFPEARARRSFRWLALFARLYADTLAREIHPLLARNRAARAAWAFGSRARGR